MTAPDREPIRLHEDVAMFRASLSFTAAQTGFSERLLEKDYFCTLVLEEFARVESLVFKGGTCLAKVHSGFYRLSEDLDYSISVVEDGTRGQRSGLVAPFKAAVDALPIRQPVFRIPEPLRGANNSTQYLGSAVYTSVLTGQEEPIKIEVGLREPLVQEPVIAGAATALINPISNSPMVAPVAIRCIAPLEAYAEKLRAALSRRDVAVRDFFDIDHALRNGLLELEDDVLVQMVGNKLAVVGNEAVDVSPGRLEALRRQVEPQLRPVLRPVDFDAFDLDRSFEVVAELAVRVSSTR